MVKPGESVAPAGTVTDAGTEAIAGWELVRLTIAPPAGAGAFNRTIFEEDEDPPAMLVGFRSTETKPIGSTVRIEDCVAPP
jgi:hypothetical protein